jgi:hypothetical protein
MNKKTKATIIFILGWMLGVLSCLIVGYIIIRIDTGGPLISPKVCGNVRIYPWKTGFWNEGMEGDINQITIEQDRTVLLTLYFDMKEQLSGFSFWNNDDMIMSYAIPLRGKNFASVDYGTLEQNLNWMDYNSDGIFDLQVNRQGSIKKILIDDEWVETEAGSKKAVVKNGESEIEYTFDHDDGKWLPVKDSELNNKE